MTGREIYKIWAQEGAKWVDWVRPVPFVTIGDNYKKDIYINISHNELKINYISNFCKNTAIIVDLNGIESINEGISLAKKGFRPIPLYNGTDEQLGSMPTTDNYSIKEGLILGAFELKKLSISNLAYPAFLLDTNRMNSFKMNYSVYDNSWDIYNQDMPSAEYLLKNDIDRIVIVTNKIQRDLKLILYEYQKKKIKIFLTDRFYEPKRIKIKKIGAKYFI